MEKNDSIYVAGSTGLVGSAIVENLKKNGYTNVITSTRFIVDLFEQESTKEFFDKMNPKYVILAAAKVGGIKANNSEPARFIVENTQIQTNVIRECYHHDVKKLLFLGSSCIYPKHAKQPIKEEYLMTGPLEETNSAYAVAKINGIEMCKSYNKQFHTNYICAMPCNIVGEHDNFDLETSHVVPALIAKFYKAKKDKADCVELWGTGAPKREFMYVDDVADACVFLMNNYDASKDDCLINVGYGKDYTIEEYAEIVKFVSGYDGRISWNTEMPDGTPRKLMDSSKLNKFGWKPRNEIKEVIMNIYSNYKIRQDLNPPDLSY